MSTDNIQIQNLPKIELSKNEIIWLKEAWNQLKHSDNKTLFQKILVATIDQTGEDFNPHLIDQRLIKNKASEITLLGVLHIEPDSEVLEFANKMILFIKKELKQNLHIEKIKIQDISKALCIDEDILGITFYLISEYGGFWNNASGQKDKIWYQSFGVTENTTFEFYMKFKSIEDTINEYYKQKERDYYGIDYEEEMNHQEDTFRVNNNGRLMYNEAKIKKAKLLNSKVFVNALRLEELMSIKSDVFDLSKLTALCKELNVCYSFDNYYSVAMLTRSIIDHIPPIFNCKNFNEVANNYKSEKNERSFKKQMTHLNNSLRNISDSFIHSQVRKSEVLPNDTQIDFKRDLDVLLAEVIRLLK